VEDFKSGQIAQGVVSVGSAAALGLSGASTIAALIFADTATIPIVGEVAGIVGLVLGVVSAILGGNSSHIDPNQQLAQSGVGNGQDYWQPDVSSASQAANHGSAVQALITLLRQILQEHGQTYYREGVRDTPFGNQLKSWINQLQALPAGENPPASLLNAISSGVGVAVGKPSVTNTANGVSEVEAMTFLDIAARAEDQPLPY
jgi:hypothetical protein